MRSATVVIASSTAVVLLVLLSGAQAWAAPPTRRVALVAHAPATIAPNGIVEITGRSRGSLARLRLAVQRRSARGWRPVSSRHASRTYVLRFHARRKVGSETLRVVALRNRRLVGASRVLHVAVRHGAATTAGPNTSATVIAPTAVTSVPAPGSAGPVVLHGSRPITVGSVLAAGIGPNTPDGFLGKVTAVSHGHGETTAQTVPTTIQSAVPEGSFDLATAKPRGAIRSATGTGTGSNRARLRAGEPTTTLSQGVSKAFSCEGEASISASGSISLTATPDFHASWSLFHGVSASYSETVRASADLSATGAASAKCTLKKTGLLAKPKILGRYLAVVDGVPLVIVLDGQLFLDGSGSADGQISAGVHGSASASGGISYARGRFSAISPQTSLSFDPQGPTIGAKADLGAHLTPELRILLYGVGGPVFDARTGLDLNADVAKNPWWAVTAPLTVSARLSAPSLGLDSPALTLFDHTYDVAHATGAFAPAPPPAAPAPAATVPSSGPTLAYAADTTLNPIDLSFDAWSAATGEQADIDTALPPELNGYRCVMLLANASLPDTDAARLTAYLHAGGTILAVGEHSGHFSAGNATLNQFAASIGAGLALDDDSLDSGDHVTSNLDPSPFTAGVVRLGYNWTSSLSLSGSAVPLAENEDGSFTMIGAQAVGTGTLIMSGDSNLVSDNNSGFFSSDYNDYFARNLCP